MKTVNNDAILDAIRYDASLDYQRRIPAATEAGITNTVKALTSYKPAWNEFVDALVNQIGAVIARNISWSNPLGEFKRGMLEFGDTVEEIQVGLLEAHVYDPDREYMEKDLFGTELPWVQSQFHRVNRQNYYKVSINQDLLKRALVTPGQLQNFVNKLMEAPMTSDQWDEFLLFSGLFNKYESNGGFFKVHVPDVTDFDSDSSDAKYALRKMRSVADLLKFPSTKYNVARMPTFAKPDELVIFTTPEFNSAIDVEALAGAFNIDRANMHGRVIPIPKERFGIEGCQAIMTVKDFFVGVDAKFETTSQYNPVSLNTNYFLHRWQIVSASRFVPAVMFTTGEDDEVVVVALTVSSVSTPTATDPTTGSTTTTVQRGGIYQLDSTVTMSDSSTGAVSYSVTGANSTKTWISSTGVLHVGGDESSNSLSVVARSVYVDPSNTRKDATASTALDLTVAGPMVPEWPEQANSITGIDVNGEAVPSFTSDTTTYGTDPANPALVLPKGSTVKKDGVVAHVNGSGDTVVTVTGSASAGYTVTVEFDPGTGASTTYTVYVGVTP
jgi:hypothetical protein